MTQLADWHAVAACARHRLCTMIQGCLAAASQEQHEPSMHQLQVKHHWLTEGPVDIRHATRRACAPPFMLASCAILPALTSLL